MKNTRETTTITAQLRKPIPGRARASGHWIHWIGGGLLAALLVAVAVAVYWPDRVPKQPNPEQTFSTAGMVKIPAGTFEMGTTETCYPNFGPDCPDGLCGPPHDAGPIHTVELDAFWMDRTPVTNAQFKEFVDATGYKTQAEEPLGGQPPSGFVFVPPAVVPNLRNHRVWWKEVKGADWRHPEGPGSGIEDRMDHPVVQVSWYDAMEYAKWAGKRLPTEAEFEYAARGGLARKRYAWGDELKPNGKWMANIWQGRFPHEDTAEDGYSGTSPVAMFPPNGYGLHDMSGNVWQWCADWYHIDYYANSPRHNPQGPPTYFDPTEANGMVPKRVQRGGSFLCSDLYCRGYMPGSRGRAHDVTATCHAGFRCAHSAD